MEETGGSKPAEDAFNKLDANDPEAFRAVFDRWCRPVFTFILGMIGNRAVAEELTQETFVRAYRGLRTVREQSRFSTWLFGVARNVAREAIRSRRATGLQVELDDGQWRQLRDRQLTQEKAMMESELQSRVQSAVAGLPEDQRLVFLLKVVSQMRYSEIAEVSGSSVAKLKTDLHRARATMRNKLAPYFEDRVAGSRGGS